MQRGAAGIDRSGWCVGAERLAIEQDLDRLIGARRLRGLERDGIRLVGGEAGERRRHRTGAREGGNLGAYRCCESARVGGDASGAGVGPGGVGRGHNSRSRSDGGRLEIEVVKVVAGEGGLTNNPTIHRAVVPIG